MFESFGLNISYNSHYLHQKPKHNDIYYPHYFKILEGTHKMAKWNITFYNKSIIPKEENFGCYFIYDNNDDLVYIGKSNSDLLSRSCVSANQRLSGDFNHIELREFKTKAETNIFEIYYISKLKPKFNSESNTKDILPFDLPQTFISQKYITSIDKRCFDSNKSSEYDLYRKECVVNGYIIFERQKGHIYRPSIPLK